MIQRAYKFRFYPSAKQIAQLNIEFGHARFVWNWALDMHRKGSNRRKKQRFRVSKIHAKIKDNRTDFPHKLSRKLINENQVIGIEGLCVKGMIRARLSKSIADTGMHELKRQLGTRQSGMVDNSL